ncbi:sulfatase-like hydrolase/transferase [Portibacter marinus]|uniref:sulfatase-like hydrolase/transferase n=1 Tax=Portibacter marinus TaxID=2898660 RepID=UPI001F1A2F92|nr:sulfatase-like hydrolase/transferase [Portibacter marinus]
MKIYMLCLCIFLAIFCGCNSSDIDIKNNSKPNFVFLFADDMTYSAVSAFGNDEIYTPNLDRMVQKGVTFTHTYNMGGWNGAICVASRAMIISGRSIWNARDFKQNWVNGDTTAYEKTWGRLMQEAGYDTYMSGKWHVDAPADSVFQTVRNVRGGMPGHQWKHHEVLAGMEDVKNKKRIDGRLLTVDDVLPLGYNRPLSESDTTWLPTDTAQGGFWEGGTHWSEVLRNDALDYINRAKERDKPFFMYLAFNAPHDHRQSPQKFIDMYPLDQISIPSSFAPEHPFKEAIGNERTLRDEALAPYPRTEYAVKVHLQEYYAIISHLDEQIGLILDALENSGQMENTYVVFTADHGLAVGKHGLLGKQSMYDHSIRVPMIIMGPDLPANQKVQNDIYLQDVMATALELAEISKPDYVEFNSIIGQAKGDSEEGNYEAIYGAYRNLQRMIRKDGYKLIVYPEADQIMLFNLEEDPEETKNLAYDKDHEAKLRQLMDELLVLQQSVNDDLDLSAMYKK